MKLSVLQISYVKNKKFWENLGKSTFFVCFILEDVANINCELTIVQFCSSFQCVILICTDSVLIL